ncbi:MAG TPA: helical backbone metal receptor [Sporichthyaceae bacterium]|jgi:ABC-type Fe3+-hydroxamate transport system substrate-binding protein|nr:helical backbone metal receptor [Sporichthyaceae bacterium]
MSEHSICDDTGAPVRLPGTVRRIVSLVPSLTEAVGETDAELLVGVTDWCTHPPGLAAARIRGTKNPDVPAVVALAPDLVLANAEENKAADIAALRAAGLAVWVTDIRDVGSALTGLGRMLEACGLGRPGWLAAAAASWAQPWTGSRRRVAVPIWRKPWMVAGADTFTTSVLDRLGCDNVFDDSPADEFGRYPRTSPEEILARGAEVVVLPDEPYEFTALDGPEAFGDLDVALVSGRLLTWYGPSMAVAREQLENALTAARPGSDWAAVGGSDA